MVPKRPSVFISYAHHDGLDFTRRLAYSLSLYMDVFWDRNLEAGPYPIQLKQQIEERDFFLLVVTKGSLESVWCTKELFYAKNSEKNSDDDSSGKILLAKPFDDRATLSSELYHDYTYGDFSEDFDAGFRRITKMMLGNPYSSWEYLASERVDKIISHLHSGILPGVIAKEVIEWLLIEVLWPRLSQYIDALELHHDVKITRGRPLTPLGLVYQCSYLLNKDTANLRDSKFFQDIVETQSFAEGYLDTLKGNVNDAQLLGKLAYSAYKLVRQVLLRKSVAERNPETALYMNQYFEFDLAEKIRESITVHSRRSRYLY